ncbi:hypothetical protein RB213_003894 [Colletotrichum asianum]
MSSSYSQGNKNASKRPKNNSGQQIPPLVPLPRRQDLNLDDLRGFESGRLDLLWITPSQKLDDQFFTEHYASVASNIKHLVKNLFRCGDLPPDGSVWAATRKYHGEKFHLERIVGMVARPDPMDPTPWEDLMTSKAKRFCVMRAVIMLVLEEQVFSELLFGATKKQSEQLHAQDSDYCHDGGIRRSRLRSTLVEMMLGHSHGMPQCFWPSVDKVAMRLLTLIFPVLNWVRRTWPPDEDMPDIKTVYQEIHNCLAYACWFAVHKQRASSVLEFTWLHPGDQYCPDQIELCPAGLQRALAASTDASSALGSNTQNASQARIARVMICVVPRLDIIKSVECDGEAVGHTITTLADTRVVYYLGLMDPDADDEVFKWSLMEHSMTLQPKTSLAKRLRAGPLAFRRFLNELVMRILAALWLLGILFMIHKFVARVWQKYDLITSQQLTALWRQFGIPEKKTTATI